MRVTFVVPEYIWGPSGGARIVYEYASRLTVRGHVVSVVHPRRIIPETPQLWSVHGWLRQVKLDIRARLEKPRVDWHAIDSRVRLLYVPSSNPKYIPDGDVIFATAWHTVGSVLRCPSSKGERCYLIQGYETFQGPKEVVDATWRAALHKIVIAKWLVDIGRELGATDVTYVPNAIDLQRYRWVTPPQERSRRVAMLISPIPIKGSEDGIRALQIVRECCADLTVVCFGTSSRLPWLPEWVTYYRNPPQEFIVDEIYNSASVFVAPSVTEGFGLPAAEAACCGCAVAATDIGGFREYLEHGTSALLSPPRDVGALARNVLRLLGDQELRMRMAAKCYQVVSQFSWDRSTEMLERFLHGVVGNKGVDEAGYLAKDRQEGGVCGGL